MRLLITTVRHRIIQIMSSTTKRSHNCDAGTSSLAGSLSKFNLHGYRPSFNLSDDENYLDIVMIITRSSKLRQGSMGCIIVQPNNLTNVKGKDEKVQRLVANDEQQFFGKIISAATNSSLFKMNDSDIHAEINAIGQVAQRPPTATTSTATTNTTRGATAYITMPPCKHCFGALYASGIVRIVSRKEHSSILQTTAQKVGIEMVSLTPQQLADQKVRVDRLFTFYKKGNDEVGDEITDDANGNEISNQQKEKHPRTMEPN